MSSRPWWGALVREVGNKIGEVVSKALVDINDALPSELRGIIRTDGAKAVCANIQNRADRLGHFAIGAQAESRYRSNARTAASLAVFAAGKPAYPVAW